MQLKSLKVFCDVVGWRSFSRAADENGISQSGASQVVNQLERRLGVKLIDRSKRTDDLRVELEVSHDGRTGSVCVLDNDADATGEYPGVGGAHVLVSDQRDGSVAQGTTDANGLLGFALPADVRARDLRVAVRAEGFNPRHLRLDGSSLAIDLREVLYG